MKKIGLLLAVFAMGAFAESWSGTITDANCGAKHVDASEKSQACAKACVKRGAAAVLVVGDKVMKFDDSSKAKVADFVGQKVEVTGDIKGDTITVASVKAE
ncbi:MAG TPA: hypothetical protein VGL53_24815 [Bryobacteraceae bacterium]|jgi:hypothetical protein